MSRVAIFWKIHLRDNYMVLCIYRINSKINQELSAPRGGAWCCGWSTDFFVPLRFDPGTQAQCRRTV